MKKYIIDKYEGERKMLNSLISMISSRYAIVVYEIIIIVILLLFIMKKYKRVKSLKQEKKINVQRAKNEKLENILKNQKKGV